MNDPEQREAVILGAVLQLPADERAAHLQNACGDDTQLLQRLTARLYDHQHRPPGQPPEVPPAVGPHHTVIVLPTEKIGDKIGRYKLLEQIGEGGFGVVYLAEQHEPIHRQVALKVIKLGMDTKSVIARFEAERQALALMDHPNIAKVLDAGVTTAGRPYFVMELVKGVPLTEYCDQHSLTVRERIELFIVVCQAIQHAHQKAIIHRDIKPSNIIVSAGPEGPIPMVIDFGLAKAVTGQRLSDKTLVTALRQFLGTLAYASPEQVEMATHDIDTRTDIYSLGVLLYELLTGKIPFEVRGPHAERETEMRRAILEHEPPLPSRRLAALPEAELRLAAKRRQVEPAKLLHLIRGDLDWILIKTLEKDRARRYETANGFAVDLKRHLKNEAVIARPPGKIYRFHKLVRRHRLFVAASTAVVVALIFGLSMSFWLLLREREARQQASSAAGKSQRVARFLVDMIKGAEVSVARGRDPALLREILGQTSDRIAHDLKNEPDVEAELRNSIGEVYASLGDYAQAEAMHRQALALRRKLYGNEHADVAQSLQNLASLLARQGRVAEAEPLYRNALKIRRGVLGETHPDVATTLQSLAALLQNRGDLAEAEADLRQALAIRQGSAPRDWQTYHARSLLGGVLLAQKKYAEAEPFILAGYEGMRQREADIPPASRSKLRDALQRQIQLYRDTNRAALAAESESQLTGLLSTSTAQP